LARLARKELRESLRDRRTLFTLVMMPLLVYPILSLAFQQFLLSSFQQTAELKWVVGADSSAEIEILDGVLAYGDSLVKAGQTTSADKPAIARPRGKLPPAAKSAGGGLSLKNGESLVVPNIDEAVHQMAIDLGVRIVPRPSDDHLHLSRKRYDYELVYRAGSPQSRQAAEFVAERLRAVNRASLDAQFQQAGIELDEPARWELHAVDEGQGESYSIATLVPLILILMTVTGAVYPAIDLTAGERERGTLEALMAAPVPRVSLLLAKFIAVLTVALLTAVINLLAMTVTLQSSGLATVLFGERGLTLSMVASVFALLVLFAGFFSAVLLTVTSFARSFKEAQAYLIPVVLLSLGPGFVSLMPDLNLNGIWAITPLANIVLLARDVLRGSVEPLPALVAIASTVLYGLAALSIAARTFGSDAILYSSQGSLSDLLRRGGEPLARPSLSGAALGAAIVYPCYVVLSGYMAFLVDQSVAVQLLGSAGVTLLLFALLPTLLARLQGVSLRSGFQLRGARPLAFVGAIVLGVSLWPLAIELVLLAQRSGLASLNEETVAKLLPGVESLLEKWRSVSPLLVLFALGLMPAICEEFFFRGYLLGAFRGRMPAWLAIGLSALLFGFFHLSVGGLIATERVLSSTLLGIVLGWICWRTGSVLPGIVLHALHNSLMLSLGIWSTELKSRGWDIQMGKQVPAVWLLASAALIVFGLALVWLGAARNAAPVDRAAE
jgi:ABC-2 type transport system permease protein/sodium transport system permease protein